MTTFFLKIFSFLIIIAAGYLLKRKGLLKAQDSVAVSRLMIYVTLPAALISGFRNFQLDAKFLLLIPLAVACNFITIALGLFLTQGKEFRDRALYVLQLSGYSVGTFVLPFIQSFMPAAGLAGTVLFDVGNCPMNCGATYGILMAATSGKKFSPGPVFRELRRSPPFFAYILMLVLSLLHIRLPDAAFDLAANIGAANTFLAMLMIGLLVEFHVPREHRALVARVLLLRYGCNGLMSAVIWLLPLPLLLRQVAVLSLLSPIPALALIYSRKCRCDEAVCGLLSSVSLIISVPVVVFLIFFWGLY